MLRLQDEAASSLGVQSSDGVSCSSHITFAQQLPAVLSALAKLPEGARVCIAAAAGLDGEAAVAAAARLAILRGVTAFQALVAVSHTRLALHLQVGCSFPAPIPAERIIVQFPWRYGKNFCVQLMPPCRVLSVCHEKINMRQRFVLCRNGT